MRAKREGGGKDGAELTRPTGVASLPKLRRNGYFEGQVLSAEDFEMEQNYFLEKQRLHNRLLHGSGVVTGLEVSIGRACVAVQPGGALDCLGNMVCVLEVTSFPPPNDGNRALYVVLRYRECEEDSVPVPGKPCRSEEDAMAPSRIVESFELALCPEDPFRDHPRHFCGFRACGQPHGVPLARLCRSGNIWSLDPQFLIPRMIPCERVNGHT